MWLWVLAIFGIGSVAGHDGGEDQSALMGSTTAIYSYKNSHSHMMKSHDWLTQTHSTGRCSCAVLVIQYFAVQSCVN